VLKWLFFDVFPHLFLLALHPCYQILLKSPPITLLAGSATGINIANCTVGKKVAGEKGTTKSLKFLSKRIGEWTSFTTEGKAQEYFDNGIGVSPNALRGGTLFYLMKA